MSLDDVDLHNLFLDAVDRAQAEARRIAEGPKSEIEF